MHAPRVAEPPFATAPAENGRFDGIGPLYWNRNPQRYPMVNVRDIESGKVQVTRELFGADLIKFILAALDLNQLG